MATTAEATFAASLRDDPRTQPGAYVTDGKALYEVVRVRRESKQVVVENVSDGSRRIIPALAIFARFRLVVALVEEPALA